MIEQELNELDIAIECSRRASWNYGFMCGAAFAAAVLFVIVYVG